MPGRSGKCYWVRRDENAREGGIRGARQAFRLLACCVRTRPKDALGDIDRCPCPRLWAPITLQWVAPGNQKTRANTSSARPGAPQPAAAFSPAPRPAAHVSFQLCYRAWLVCKGCSSHVCGPQVDLGCESVAQRSKARHCIQLWPPGLAAFAGIQSAPATQHSWFRLCMSTPGAKPKTKGTRIGHLLGGLVGSTLLCSASAGL